MFQVCGVECLLPRLPPSSKVGTAQQVNVVVALKQNSEVIIVCPLSCFHVSEELWFLSWSAA